MLDKKIYLTRYQQSPFGRLKDTDIEKMLLEAGSQGLDDIDRTKIDHIGVAGLLTPILNDQSLIAGLLAMDPAYCCKSITAVNNACDSGGLAILDCVQKILAGQAHATLAIGVEKMHPLEGKLDSGFVGKALGTCAHKDDLFPPFTFPHAFAVIMDAYMKKYKLTEEEFAVVSPVFYANASHNPLAHMHKPKAPVTPETVLQSYRLFQDPPMPLKLFECSQISDGWARILVCDEEGLNTLGIPKSEATLLAGFGQAVDSLSLESRGDSLLAPKGAKKAFNDAMNMAGAKPSDIDVQEVHDCFTVMAALAVETTEAADVGQGVKYYAEGHANVDGKCPINTSGGLIAKGHPISATGVAMVGWLNQQLLHKVPEPLQVKDPKFATSLNIGGPICSTVVIAQKLVE